jgi:hypothetical protein
MRGAITIGSWLITAGALTGAPGCGTRFVREYARGRECRRRAKLQHHASLTGADTGAAAALAVPIQNFNANAKSASAVVRLIADGPTYSAPIALSSTQIAVFRAVPVTAP